MSVHFYGYDFEGIGVFHFFAFMHSFQKLASDFGGFETLCVVGKDTENALHANECEWMNRAIHCKSGSSFMGQAVNSGIAPGIWNVLPILIRDAKSCIDCEPHKGWPIFAMNGSIHSFTLICM